MYSRTTLHGPPGQLLKMVYESLLALFPFQNVHWCNLLSVGSVRLGEHITLNPINTYVSLVEPSWKQVAEPECTELRKSLRTWLRECFRQVKAEVISNSNNKLHQTTCKYYFQPQYVPFMNHDPSTVYVYLTRNLYWNFPWEQWQLEGRTGLIVFLFFFCRRGQCHFRAARPRAGRPQTNDAGSLGRKSLTTGLG